MDDATFRRALNDEQYAAATAPDGPALVLAAAGTGKTRTLVYRVAFLAHRGISPERMLLLTFTNRAASEMLERAESLVGPGISGVWGGTFHHMANRILRRHADRLGLRHDYTILDQDDARSLVSQCVRDRKLDRKEFPKREVLLSLFSAAANMAKPLADLAEKRLAATDADVPDVLRIHGDYQRRKREMHAVDFDDLLILCLDLLRGHADLCARYQAHFHHVLVDEYQDTNPIQAELVDRLAAGSRNLLVVGDDFQSIYGWRGADFRNIMSFPTRYPDAHIYKLETNYRSVPEILAVANTCIAGNPEQFQKTLRATREAYRRPRVIRVYDGAEQARRVVEQIRLLQRAGYKPDEIAVLYRAHFHAMELQLEFARAQVGYTITSGLRFFEQAHIKDVCSLLRVLENPGDELAFTRLVTMLPGVGPRTAAKLWQALGRRFDVSPEGLAAVRKALKPGAQKPWQPVEAICGAYARENLRADPGAVMDRYLEEFYEEHATNTYDDVDRRLEEIRELIAFSGRFGSVGDLLSEVALLTNVDAEGDAPEGERKPAVRLSTVHQAKGLEWGAVIVLWVTEGMFPSSRSIQENADGEAEERRLFYVAVTRAKDELILCVPSARHLREGGTMTCVPSRFLAELPRALVEELRPAWSLSAGY